MSESNSLSSATGTIYTAATTPSTTPTTPNPDESKELKFPATDNSNDTSQQDDVGFRDPLQFLLPWPFLRWPRRLLWHLLRKLLLFSPITFLMVIAIQLAEHVFMFIISFGAVRETSDIAAYDEATHPFQVPTHDQKRSPCPALNMLANHGYLPRNGLNITRTQMIHGLQHGFRLSYPLAWLITHGGYLLTGQFRMMSLHDLRRHNGIEHNASLAHADAEINHEYAPAEHDEELYAELEHHSKDGSSLTIDEFARARIRREKECYGVLDPTHAEIARGEVALILDIFGTAHRSIDLKTMRRIWTTPERFPPGWKPTHEQTLARTVLTAQGIKQRMIAFRKETEYKQNMIQKFLKVYMIFCEPPPSNNVCHLHGCHDGCHMQGCPKSWRNTQSGEGAKSR